MRVIAVVLLVLALAGCQARSTSTATAAPPKVVLALTDQTLVYSCPSCGMDFEGPGKCPMDQAELVKTQVAYVCPADNQPVAKAGRCPRCEINARVVKTAVADAAPAGPANEPAPSEASTGNGS